MTLERRIPWETKNTSRQQYWIQRTAIKNCRQVNVFTPRGTPFLSHKASKEGLSAWSWIRLDARMKQSAKNPKKIDSGDQPLPCDVSSMLHDSWCLSEISNSNKIEISWDHRVLRLHLPFKHIYTFYSNSSGLQLTKMIKTKKSFLPWMECDVHKSHKQHSWHTPWWSSLCHHEALPNLGEYSCESCLRLSRMSVFHQLSGIE